MNIYLICFFLLTTISAFPDIKIEPEQQLHDKSKSLIVKCNATSINERPVLVYSYKNINYNIPPINKENPFVYVGNLSLTDPDQFRVNIMCLNHSDGFISSKIYFFGYSPAFVLTGDSTPRLNCQNFNLRRIICCMTPGKNEIVERTGLVEEQNGHLNIELINLESNEKEFKLNSSCFNLLRKTFTSSLSLTLVISNDLGSQEYNFSFDMFQIFKPEAPIVNLTAIDKNNLELIITMIDDGEFIVNATCSSNSPINVVKNFNRSVIGRTIKEILNGWIPYSIVSCIVHSKISFGPSSSGQFSEPTMSELKMPQAEPNCGPMISPAFMAYHTVAKDGYLENVIVYFVDLQMIDQNGVIIYYDWKCEDCLDSKGYLFGTERLSNDSGRLSNNSRSIRISRAKVNGFITITACTKIGCSNNWSKLRFRKLPIGNLNTRIYLIQNGNHFNLWWYLNNQTFTQMPLNALVCYTTKNDKSNSCSSTKLISLDNKLIGQKSLDVNNMIPVKFAFILSPNDSQLSQLTWINCTYEKSTNSEIERTLSIAEFKGYVTHITDCHLSKCNGSLKIKIPPCRHLNSVILNGIRINYKINASNKSISQDFLSSTEIQIQLPDLHSDTNYNISISIITSDNESIFWMNYLIYTGWFAIYKVVLISIGIFLLLVFVTFLIYVIYKKNTDKIYQKKFVKCITHKVIKSSTVRPLNLINAENQHQFSRIDTDACSTSDSSLPIIPNTNSTMIYNQTSDSSYSSTDSSRDQKNLESQISNGNYIKRPDLPKGNEEYMHFVLPLNKGKNDGESISNGFSQECVEV